MKWAILSYLILNPLFYVQGAATRDVQTLFFQFSSLTIFIIGTFFYQKPVIPNKINVTLGVLFLMFGVACVKSGSDLNFAFSFLLNFLCGLLVYFTIIKTMSKEDTKFILVGVLCMAFFALLWLGLNYLGFDIRDSRNIGDWKRINRNAMFYQRSAMGIYFGETLPLVTAIIPFSFVFFLPIYLSQCAIAGLGSMTGFMFFLWFRKRIFFWILLIPLVAGGFYFINTRENFKGLEFRLPIYKKMIHDIAKNPFGYGLDSFNNPKEGLSAYYQYPHNNRVVKIRNKGENWQFVDEPDQKFLRDLVNNKANLRRIDNPHSEYFWIGYEIGLWGLVALGFLYYYVWMRFWESQKDVYTVALMGGLISFVIIMAVQFPLHLARVGHLLPVIGGLFYISTEE
jgi:hypothetical protein